jgi:branched-chain amino acid transport system substrate-binding protein
MLSLREYGTRRGGAGIGRGVAALAILVVVAVAGLASYAALGSSLQPSKSTTTSTSSIATYTSSHISIGYLTELTGTGSSDGYAAMYGAELAVNETNRAGGVAGRTIDLVVADSQTNPSIAQQQAAGLDQGNHLLAITGPTDPNDAMAIRGYAESHGVPLIVPAAASAALTVPGSNWTVRIEPDSVQSGVATAKYVSEAIPNAKIALMAEDALEQKEMAAGVRWYVNTFKNASLVYDQSFTSTLFPWATAAAAIKASGANAVVLAWLPGFGSSENAVITAIQAAGIHQSQIFMVDAADDVATLGTNATGMRGITFFDQSIAHAFPNASAFVSEVQPLIPGCAPCPKTVGNSYYFGYLGMKVIINAIQSVISSGQPLTRGSFISSVKQTTTQDLFGNTLKFDSTGSSNGSYYVVQVQSLMPDQPDYNLELLTSVTFASGSIPVAQILK